jgi:hypothetical protein
MQPLGSPVSRNISDSTIYGTPLRLGRWVRELTFQPFPQFWDTSIQMTMRYVHPAEEEKRFAAGKVENFRFAEMVEAMEKRRQATTISASVQ